MFCNIALLFWVVLMCIIIYTYIKYMKCWYSNTLNLKYVRQKGNMRSSRVMWRYEKTDISLSLASIHWFLFYVFKANFKICVLIYMQFIGTMHHLMATIIFQQDLLYLTRVENKYYWTVIFVSTNKIKYRNLWNKEETVL